MALVLAVASAGAASAGGQGSNGAGNGNGNGRSTEQRFTNPRGWELRDLTAALPTTDVVEYVTEITTADDVITVGVRPEPGDTAADIEANIQATLADMTASDAASAATDHPTSPALAASYRAAQQAVERGTPRITRVTLKPNAHVPALLQDNVVDETTRAAATTSTRTTSRAAGGQITPMVNGYSCSEPWWPDYMQITAQPSTVTGERYGRTYFQWTTNARLYRLQSCENSSFEPDYVTYNDDDLHYFSSTVTTWTSNLPSGYQDTSFGDSADEPTYTVGTPNTLNLVADKEYTTYFRAKNGNTSSDTAKLNAQRGVRIPPSCTSTWCIFARDTERFPTSGWLSIPTQGWTVYK